MLSVQGGHVHCKYLCMCLRWYATIPVVRLGLWLSIQPDLYVCSQEQRAVSDTEFPPSSSTSGALPPRGTSGTLETLPVRKVATAMDLKELHRTTHSIAMSSDIDALGSSWPPRHRKTTVGAPPKRRETVVRIGRSVTTDFTPRVSPGSIVGLAPLAHSALDVATPRTPVESALDLVNPATDPLSKTQGPVCSTGDVGPKTAMGSGQEPPSQGPDPPQRPSNAKGASRASCPDLEHRGSDMDLLPHTRTTVLQEPLPCLRQHSQEAHDENAANKGALLDPRAPAKRGHTG